MYNKIFVRSTTEAKYRKRLFDTYDSFIAWMQERDYSRKSIQVNIRAAAYFGRYLNHRKIHFIHQLEGEESRTLLLSFLKAQWRRGKRYKYMLLSGARVFVQALREKGILKDLGSNIPPLFNETQQYLNFLKNLKGLRESTISIHRHWVEKFLQFLGHQKGAVSLPKFGIAHVDRFIEQEGVRIKRRTQKNLTLALRGFLHFLYQSGKLPSDLSPFVVTPLCYKLESVPQVLKWDEIQKVLNSVDRSTKLGIRNYAILTLLANYGLRAGEITGLRLENIDWRKETIHITPRKSGRDLWLPLIPEVGKAIFKYLKVRHSPSKYRKIFLGVRAPFVPMTSNVITYTAHKYMQLAGVDPREPGYGSHLFRHSFASNLVCKELPLNQVKDMLGHESLESTHIYTKVAIEQLRDVALEIPKMK